MNHTRLVLALRAPGSTQTLTRQDAIRMGARGAALRDHYDIRFDEVVADESNATITSGCYMACGNSGSKHDTFAVRVERRLSSMEVADLRMVLREIRTTSKAKTILVVFTSREQLLHAASTLIPPVPLPSGEKVEEASMFDVIPPERFTPDRVIVVKFHGEAFNGMEYHSCP